MKESAQIHTSGVAAVGRHCGQLRRPAQRALGEAPAGSTPLVDAGGRLGQPAATGAELRSIRLASRGGGRSRPTAAAGRGRSAQRGRRLPGVLLVQGLGLVGRHVHARSGSPGAALAGQAQVERLVDRGVGEPPGASRRRRLLEHPGAPAGGVLLVAGGEVGRAHHAAVPVLSATHLPTPVHRCTALPRSPPSCAGAAGGGRRRERGGRRSASSGAGSTRTPGLSRLSGSQIVLTAAEQRRATRRRTSAAAAPSGPGRRRARRTCEPP